MLNQLRFGRGVDNRRLKARGFHYGYTSREAVLKLGEHLRLHPLIRNQAEPYRYEREVEDFLRWSPNVRSSKLKEGGGLSREQLAELERLLSAYEPTVDDAPEPDRSVPPAPVPAVEHYDDLGSEEIISMLGSLDRQGLTTLRDHEVENRARDVVISAIDSVLARRAAASS